jgi:hypothetical protein
MDLPQFTLERRMYSNVRNKHAYPHTEMLHVVQRYRRPDAGHIEKEVTIEDPGTFTKPWRIRQTWELVPGEEVHEYICNENERDASHLKGK